MIQNGYFVCYSPGTSGAFIASLVAQIVNSSDRKFEFTPNGNSHANMVDANGGLDWARAPNPVTPEYFYQNLFTFNSGRPMVVQTHFKPVWNTLAERWPTFKVVMVTHDDKDLEEIAANLFYKYYLDEFDSVAKEAFLNVINTQAPYAFSRNITDPATMTEDEIKLFTKIVVFHKITDGFMYPDIPEKYKDQVLKLKYKDITTNKEGTLSALSTFLGMSVPEITSQNYDAYIAYQKKLLSEKATWVKPYDY